MEKFILLARLPGFPMGANLQLIFYRDKKNDILVKFLLNECEVTLPLKSKMVLIIHGKRLKLSWRR